MATDITLVSNLYRNGCFSRPEESYDSFLKLSSSWMNHHGNREWKYPQHINDIFLHHFDIEIQNIPMEISQKGLMPWELACCWTDVEGHSTIQIRSTQRSQNRVDNEALLTHEAIHAVRGRLFSTKYEEFCAYAACHEAFPKTFPWWRSFLGPLFLSPQEVIIVLLLIWGIWGTMVFLDGQIPTGYVVGFSCIPVALLFGRLLCRWTRWNKALKNIGFEWPHTTWRLMIRLADSEIDWIANLPQKHVRTAIEDLARTNWRWNYFLDAILES